MIKYYKINYPTIVTKKEEFDLVSAEEESRDLYSKGGFPEGQVIQCTLLASSEESFDGEKPDKVFFSKAVWEKKTPILKKDLPLYIDSGTKELSKILKE
jgi:hypothetical protein